VDFLKKFNCTMCNSHVNTDTTLIKAFRDYLKTNSPAEDWYADQNALNTKPTWDEFETAFKMHFPGVQKVVRKTLKLNSLFFFIYFCPREPKCNFKCSQTDCGNNTSHTCNYSIGYTPVCACPHSTIKYSKIYVT